MISFYNAGIINEVSITTFGINAKDNSSAIGIMDGLPWTLLQCKGYNVQVDKLI